MSSFDTGFFSNHLPCSIYAADLPCCTVQHQYHSHWGQAPSDMQHQDLVWPGLAGTSMQVDEHFRRYFLSKLICLLPARLCLGHGQGHEQDHTLLSCTQNRGTPGTGSIDCCNGKDCMCSQISKGTQSFCSGPPCTSHAVPICMHNAMD